MEDTTFGALLVAFAISIILVMICWLTPMDVINYSIESTYEKPHKGKIYRVEVKQVGEYLNVRTGND